MSDETEDAPDAALEAVLVVARARGFLGATVAPSEHISHARAFTTVVTDPPPHAVDLGSGGGLPGLVLAAWWPTSAWLLVDAQQRRTDFLSWAVRELGLSDRVAVCHGRAEAIGRDPAWRGRCELVVARSFGPPAVVAECAAGFLAVGGRLVVSEPPDPDGSRWDTAAAAEGLQALGLAVVDAPVPRPPAAARLQVLDQQVLCPERYPRRAGIPAKRPLF